MRTLALILCLLVIALAACQSEDPAPTQIILVVTATPDPATPATPTPMIIVVTATPDAISQPATPATADTPEESGSPASATPTDPLIRVPSVTPLPSETPTATPSPEPPTATARPANFPTDVVAQAPIAEQVFERGRMVWLRPTRPQQIWVMQASPDDPNSGDYFCFYDTFVEGEQEIDPALVAPADRYQPRRGFGKLWRNNQQVREALGWGITPEFELTSSYRYIAGGPPGPDGVRPPGTHQLTTLYNELILFNEIDIRGDCIGGTWELRPNL